MTTIEDFIRKREFRVQQETEYKVNNISLVKSYIIKKKKNMFCYLIINGVKIKHTSEDKNYLYFDFEEIRNTLREVIPMTEEDNELCALETMFTYNSLCAQNAYKKLSNLKEAKRIFNNSIFTNQDIEVKIKTNCRDSFITLEEEHYLSDVHCTS